MSPTIGTLKIHESTLVCKYNINIDLFCSSYKLTGSGRNIGNFRKTNPENIRLFVEGCWQYQQHLKIRYQCDVYHLYPMWTASQAFKAGFYHNVWVVMVCQELYGSSNLTHHYFRYMLFKNISCVCNFKRYLMFSKSIPNVGNSYRTLNLLDSQN